MLKAQTRRLSRRVLVLLGLNAAALGLLARVAQERRAASERQTTCLEALAEHRALYQEAKTNSVTRVRLASVEREIREWCG